MPSLGHVAVGVAAGRLFAGSADGVVKRGWMIWFSVLSLLPDADLVAFGLGIPYGAEWGHRGAGHSLALAVFVGLAAGLVAARRTGSPAARTALLSAGVLASHGLLDTLTDGGLGIALLWPFSRARFFAPWDPIPVAPLGRTFLGPRGLRVVLTEAAYFSPLLLYAFWPRRRP